MVLGFGLLTQVGMSSLSIVVAACVLMMVGFGLVVTLTSDMIVSAAPPERAGAASAISETGSELGGALGIAVLGSIGAAVYRRQVADAVPAGVPPEAATTARDTLGGAVGVAGQLSEGLGEALLAAARAAYIDGLHLVAACGVVILIGVAILAALWLPRRQPGPEPEEHSDAAATAACPAG